jgi:hypothetical protein
MDVRVDGRCRVVFRHQDSPLEFFDACVEVTPHPRRAIFDENAGKSFVAGPGFYRSATELDLAVASGSAGGKLSTLDQLDELLLNLKSNGEAK